MMRTATGYRQRFTCTDGPTSSEEEVVEGRYDV